MANLFGHQHCQNVDFKFPLSRKYIRNFDIKPTRMGRRKSHVWKFFVENLDSGLETVSTVTCTICQFRCSRGGVGKGATTSGMLNHLKKKHTELYLSAVAEESKDQYVKCEPDLGDDLSPLDFLVQNEPITALSVEGEVRIKEEPGDWNPADYDMVNVGSNDTGEIKPSDNETKCSSMEEDDHWYYLRSLLPFFRQLDDMQTLRVRTKFQQILMSELSTKDPNALTMFNVSSSNLGQHT